MPVHQLTNTDVNLEAHPFAMPCKIERGHNCQECREARDPCPDGYRELDFLVESHRPVLERIGYTHVMIKLVLTDCPEVDRHEPVAALLLELDEAGIGEPRQLTG